MLPGNSCTDRFNRLLFSFIAMFVVVVLVTLGGAGVPASFAEEAPGRYGPILAKRWQVDEIRALPDGPQRIERELYRQGEYSRRWNLIHDLLGAQHLSRKSREFLGRRGLGPALFDKGAGDPNLPAGAQAMMDTLKVLIIRIGFETNRDPHLTTVDPSGDFVLEPLADPQPLEVDPPPRNKAFFEAHLQGLSEYYRIMSGGRLHIEGRVLPEDSDASYKLTDVADYGPGAGNFWTLDGLERLVQDTIRQADQETQADGSVNLGDYDDNTPFTYIIFVHAGSDWQSDINGDSPNDIPTFFVTLGEPIDLAGPSGGPDGGPGQLSECSIIPETTNQDGYPGSIAAAFYHEFGHALGLPDVYSTYSGLPSVGIWDLMDSGTNLSVTMGTIVAPGDTFVISAAGVLPPSISAWNKWFLGWLDMGELDGREGEYSLPPVGVPKDQYGKYPELIRFAPDHPQAYRAGLSPREWFLLENRWVPSPGAPFYEPLPYEELRFERDEPTGVILYLAGKRVTPFGTDWENSGYYDYFMPPGGLLVWHVNSDRIEAGLPDNTINIYNDGLKLVEADGIQDIGVLESYVIGWYGSYLDPFGGSDYYGNSTGFQDLYVEGFPSSRNFDRSWSGLSLSEIGPRTRITKSVMEFKANQVSVGPGFPYELPSVQASEAPGGMGQAGPRAIDLQSLTPVTLNGGTQQVLVFADEVADGFSGGDYPAYLFHRWADGQRRWTESTERPAGSGAFQPLDAPLSGSPFTRDRTDGDGVDLVYGTRAGSVGMTHLPDYAMPAESWTTQVGDSLSGGATPLIWQGVNPRILCPVHPNSLVLLDESGNILGPTLDLSGPDSAPVSWMKIATPVMGADDSDLAAVLSDEGWHLVGQDAAGLVAEPPFYPFYRMAADSLVWTAVVTAAGLDHLLVFDAEGELGTWSIAPDGSVTDLGSVLEVEAPLVTSPAVADVDGDGRDDLVLATAERIHCLRPDGVSVRGFPVRFYDLFPLPDTTRICGPVVVADGTGDGINEIYFNSDGGHLVGLNATGKLLPHTPLRWADRRTAGLAVGGPDDARALWLVSAGGYTGPPLDRQFVNGRVIGFSLADAADETRRTSEWRGPGGGSVRRGSEGVAKGLGPTAPVTTEIDRVVLYPNPMVGDQVTVRFFSGGSRPARLSIYNLEGEAVATADIPVNNGVVNEFSLPLPGVASGLYLARLEYDAGSGIEIRTLTLAVEK